MMTPLGSGGCPFYAYPFDNTGGQVCDAQNKCAAGTKGCEPIWNLYPVYFIGGAALLVGALILSRR